MKATSKASKTFLVGGVILLLVFMLADHAAAATGAVDDSVWVNIVGSATTLRVSKSTN